MGGRRCSDVTGGGVACDGGRPWRPTATPVTRGGELSWHNGSTGEAITAIEMHGGTDRDPNDLHRGDVTALAIHGKMLLYCTRYIERGECEWSH